MLKNEVKRPLLKRAFFFSICLILLSSCAQMKTLFYRENPIVPNNQIPGIQNKDYVSHVIHLEESLKENRRIKFKRLTARNRDYLTRVFYRVVTNNELLLPQNIKPKFSIVRDKTPFIFSLPHFHFYISTGLVKRYLKNEALLLAAFGFEIVKSGRNVFEKKRVIPLGVTGVKDLLTLTRVDYSTKLEIYKWTYYALRRSEYDAAAILNWIQTQNKNALDFSWQIRDPRGVSREELAFKSFLVAQGIEQFELSETNSSKDFYKFKDSI